MRLLRAALAQPSHAYLFTGPPHVGKTTTAMAFAQALNCAGESSGCGICLECRALLHGNHPDVRFVQASEGKKVFALEDLRQLIEEVSWKPLRGRHKVYVLPNDLLNLQGANALLKTLEEPSPGTILILLATSTDRVLPTLVSRCQLVPFGPVAPQAIAEWLISHHDQDPMRAQHLARISDGRIGWAAEQAHSKEDVEPAPLWGQTYASMLSTAEALAQEETDQQIVALEALIAQVRDIMVYLQTGRTDWIAEPPKAIAAARWVSSLSYWWRCIRRLEEARLQVLGHANGKLLWTVLAGDLLPTARELAEKAASR